MYANTLQPRKISASQQQTTIKGPLSLKICPLPVGSSTQGSHLLSYDFSQVALPTVPIKLPIDFLGRINGNGFVRKTLRQPCGRGRTQNKGSVGGADRCVAWDLQEAQKGQIGSDSVTLGHLRDSVSEGLGRKCDQGALTRW